MSAMGCWYHSVQFYFFCSLISSLVIHIAAGRELKFAVILYRHGDRSPIATFPNDNHTEDSWPDGFGQLTKLGKQQQYELGRYLRTRYARFLNASYRPSEVYVRSTDIDRTIMSAQANLAGLFQPAGDQIWNSSIFWQPIPVHTVSKTEDKLLLMPFSNCPLYEKLVKETFSSKEYHQLVEPYLDFLNILSKNTGFSIEQLSQFGAWTTYDALFCETIHNYSLPTWASKETMNKLQHLSEIILSANYGIYRHQEKSRLQGGVLLNSIIQNITNMKETPSFQRRILIYSAGKSESRKEREKERRRREREKKKKTREGERKRKMEMIMNKGKYGNIALRCTIETTQQWNPTHSLCQDVPFLVLFINLLNLLPQ
eukprot:XP_012820985.2 PREDICTED: prostatic acid phosphatase isoform X3 [Xenopus tropicalis]